MNIPYQPLSDYLALYVHGHFDAGCGTCAPADLTQNNIQLADDVDIALGRHHISAGGEWVNYRGYVIEIGRLAAGEFDFNGQATNDSLVDFMLGLPSIFYQGNMQRYHGRQNYYGAYVHDVFQVTKKVTAQLGVRWEPNLWGQESDMQMQHFNMAAFSAGTIRQRISQCSGWPLVSRVMWSPIWVQ